MWFGIISKWTGFSLTVNYADPIDTPIGFAMDAVKWRGKPVINWFVKEFFTTASHRTKHGTWTMTLKFDPPEIFEIAGKEHRLKAVACTGNGVYIKKKKWVTFVGDAFFDWHMGKVVIPPSVQVYSAPVEADLLTWDDYRGEIPGIGNQEGVSLARGVFMMTQTFDSTLPVPDFEIDLAKSETIITRDIKPAPPADQFPFVLNIARE